MKESWVTTNGNYQIIKESLVTTNGNYQIIKESLSNAKGQINYAVNNSWTNNQAHEPKYICLCSFWMTLFLKGLIFFCPER